MQHFSNRDDQTAISSYVSTKISYFENQYQSYERDLTAQISIRPSSIDTNIVDEPLKRYVMCHQKSLSARINADIGNFRASVKENQLLSILSSDRIQDEQVWHIIYIHLIHFYIMFCFDFSSCFPQRAIINRIISLRQSQLKTLEELWILERRILIGILPPAYDQIDEELAPSHSLSVVYHGKNRQELHNEYKKMVKAKKRTMLQDEMRNLETVIENYDHQLQYELFLFQRRFPERETNDNSLLQSMKTYIENRTTEALCRMGTQMTQIRIRLTRRLRRSTKAQNAIKVFPEVILDAPDVPLNDAELNYLGRGKT